MAAPATSDPEALLIAWLSEQFPHLWCATDLPPDLEERLPVCQVTRTSGARSAIPWSHIGRGLLDNPRFDLDCYARTRAQARDETSQVCDALWALRNTARSGVLISNVIEESGPSWRPDFNPRVRRFGATYVLTVRPL